MSKTKINWTDKTWNPVTGCTKLSDGCANCYAEKMAHRLQAIGSPKYKDGFSVRCHMEELSRPLFWKKPCKVFVNSMSDLFHEEVPQDFLLEVFNVMKDTPHLTYQVLTKRADRMEMFSKQIDWPKNVWAGVTVENQKVLNRIDKLRAVKAQTKFVSFEPLISSVNGVCLLGVDWAIVGGESGARARQMREEWVLEIKEACELAGSSFFFKQWGGVNKQKNGRTLQGEEWDGMPES